MAQSSPQIPMRQMSKHKTVQKPSAGGNQQHDQQFYVRIAKKAYELFERRGGEHGHDVDDWLEAERLVVEELHQGLQQDRP
jgi:Protein of unknown function (DUF2934)